MKAVGLTSGVLHRVSATRLRAPQGTLTAAPQSEESVGCRVESEVGHHEKKPLRLPGSGTMAGLGVQRHLPLLDQPHGYRTRHARPAKKKTIDPVAWVARGAV